MTNEHITRGSIIVGVDGSDHAERAVLWAVEQASLEKRRLVVLHADKVLTRTTTLPTSSADPAELRSQVVVGTDAIVDEACAFATSRGPHLDIQPLVVQTDPRQALVDASRHARLIVVGSRGRGGVRSMFLGSVSANVTRHAECPVVVIRPDRANATRSGVLVGADGTPESQPVVEFAFRQASLRGQPLTIMHTFFDAAAAVAEYRGHAYEGPGAEMESLLAESVAGLAEKYSDVPVIRSFAHGLVDECLVNTPGEWAMVVIGRHPTNSLTRVLSGSVAITVLERSKGVVAMVPEEASLPISS